MERIEFFVDSFFFPFDMIVLTIEAIFLPSRKTIFSLIQTQPSLFVLKTKILVLKSTILVRKTTILATIIALVARKTTGFNAWRNDAGEKVASA